MYSLFVDNNVKVTAKGEDISDSFYVVMYTIIYSRNARQLGDADRLSQGQSRFHIFFFLGRLGIILYYIIIIRIIYYTILNSIVI